MKHLKTFFAFMLMSVLSIGQVWATDVTFTPGTDTGATSVTKSGVTCTMTTMNNSSYYQIYANQSGTFSVSTGNITKIEFTCTASGTSKYGPGNVSANVGSYSYSGTKGTWTGEASSVTLSSTAQVRMSALTITISVGGSDPVNVTGVSLAESAISLEVGATQTLVAAIEPSGATDQVVSWSSDDESVATVDEDGVVTAESIGNATITVTTHDGSFTATCDVEVIAAQPKSILNFTAACGGTGTANDGAVWTITSDGAESNFDSGRGIHYGTGSASVQYIQLTTSHITGTIKSVVVNASDAKGTAEISVSVGETDFTCSGSTTVTNSNPGVDYTFTGSKSGSIIVRVDRGSAAVKAIYVKSIVVTYEEAEETQVATPEIAGTNNFYPSTSVSISCGTDGAAIYYSTDGSAPSTLYSEPFEISATTTVKAKATKSGLDDSEVASKTFTKATPLATIPNIFSAATGTATDQIISFSNTWVVTGISTNGKNAYLTDGTNGLILFNNSASAESPVAGLEVGNTLSGTVTRSLVLYNGAAELKDFTAEGLTKGSADVPAVQNLDAAGIADLGGVNTGSLIKISGQCIVDNSKYYIKYGSGDNDKVQVYNTLYAFGSLTANANYECTGVYVQFNTTKEICPRSAADLVQEVEKNQPETQWVAATKTVRMGDATTNWWSTSSDGAKSFSSSNTEVATITNEGVINLVAPGTTTLTFSTAETSNYYSGKATLTLTVKAALPIGGTEFTWDATAQEYSDKEVLSTVTEAPNPIITFAKTGTTDPQWYNNGSAVRFYKDNSITVTAPDNKLLYQIEINFVSEYVKTLTTDVEAYSVEGTVGTWSGMAKEVTFSNGDGAARLTSINVIYANGTVTELEIANINLKTTDSETALTITKNVDATIVYTGLDESVATISNNKVTPVGVGSTTVTASIAAGSNYTAASATFTITVSAKAIPEMSFPQASYNANLGESFTAPVLTKPEGVTVQYSSNNAAVSVDENTGAIMLNTEGSAVITATSVENDNYAVGTASYTLNVTDPYKDVLTAIGIGQSGYGDWSNKTFTTEVKYAGNSTTGTGDKSGTIQMRVQNPSGIVSTSTIGYLKNISATATKNGTNTLEIYAKNTPYESGADLYEGSTSGTLIGTIAAGGGEMVFEDGHAYSDNYKYIGIKAKGGAVYYDEIVIKWTPATFNKYTVTYEAGDATGADVEVNDIEEGTPIQLQDNSYSYEGHIFVGWSDGTNVYEEGDNYTVNGNVTFTAQWAEQYTVTYNPGAASGDAIVRTVAAGAYNLEVGSIFTYEGHAFDGWLKGETKYNAGASYTISENVAFTAQWVESQDPVTVTFVAGTDKSTTMSLVKNGITLSYETSSGTFNRDDDYRCYSGKTLTIASEVGNITNIAFTLTQNTFTTGTGTYENGSWNGSAESIVFTTSGGQVRMTEIAVTYIPNGNTPKQPAGLSYDQTSYTIAQNEGFTAPTLNNPNNLVVTYSGNNDEVATVNAETGAITLGEATGTVTITANAAAQGDFLAGTASYTLTVNAPIVIDDLSGTWALVTDPSQLVAGKKVIIASVPEEGAATTMSTTQAANNRIGLAGATISNGVISAPNGTAVFTIEAGTVDKTIAFKSSANGYLYAASSGSNYIRSQETNDANGSWNVSISEGVATITAQGEFTRNVMRHNPNTSGDNPLFACYASSSTTGTLITLYMLEEESPVTPDPEPETPDYTREVTANRYGTICIPQGGRMVDAILFEIAWHSVGEQKIYFDEIVDGTMVPGRPYIFWPKNTTIGVIYSEEDEAEEAGSYNGLVGSFAGGTIAHDDENYILYANNFYLVNIEGAAKVGANKAYVHMGDVRTTEQPQAPGRRRVSMGVQGEQVATDILNAELNAQPMKVIIDNQLFIIREGKKYDMTGNLVK